MQPNEQNENEAGVKPDSARMVVVIGPMGAGTDALEGMVGAAINVRRPASGESAFLHEVTVVVYGRPEHIAATDKNASPEQALKGALDAAERQVRQRRKKLKEHWKRPGNLPSSLPGKLPIEQEIEDELDET